MSYKLKSRIVDGAQIDDKGREVTVTATNMGIDIEVEGYGDGTSKKGGSILLLEIYEGKLLLRAYGDINSDEPTQVLDLEGASESKRDVLPEVKPTAKLCWHCTHFSYLTDAMSYSCAINRVKGLNTQRADCPHVVKCDEFHQHS